MMKTCGAGIWHIAVYIRLSREDGNDESLSVANQRKIAIDYLESSFDGDYVMEDCYIDDGVSGTDYDRPAFRQMLSGIKAGRINCIVCKNLSRMFRNYADQGYFLEKVFPLCRTRLITISEPRLDTFLHPEAVEGLEIPISGLMNDRLAAKTSRDVRDTFAAKRRRGEFIGAFAPFGYEKSPEDKNRLIIDVQAAEVVRNIFRWYLLEGMSKRGIARRLNDEGVMNPTAYKCSRGQRYFNPHSTENDGHWSASTVSGILKNRMYTGTMVQGKQRVISYKVHSRTAVSPEEWVSVRDTHEPVIDREMFEAVQALQEKAMRTAPGEGKVHLLAGLMRCADCKKAMTRQKTGKYVYYYCRTFREKSAQLCGKHAVREETVKEVLLRVLRMQIGCAADPARVLEEMEKAPEAKKASGKERMQHCRTELDRLDSRMDQLYEDWKSGEISREEYRRLKRRYSSQKEQIVRALERQQKEEDDAGKKEDEAEWEFFLRQRSIIGLRRGLLTELVRHIDVHQDGEIEIEFRFADPNCP